MISIRRKRTIKTYGLRGVCIGRVNTHDPSSTFVQVSIEGGSSDELVMSFMRIDLIDLKEIVKVVKDAGIKID